MKGMFSQGAFVLTDGSLAGEAITRALAGFKVVKRKPADAHPGWMGGSESWLIEMRPEVNGYVIVDAVNAPWPDHMGDPKAGGTEPMGPVMLFGAWTMGIMGPHTFPGNLERAKQFAAAYGQEEAAQAAEQHRAFVRIRSSYILGGDKDSKILPPDYDARQELDFVTSVARALTKAPGAICYFNPGAETLFSASGLDRVLDTCASDNLPPLPVWSGRRLIRLDEQAPGWRLADTVGMEQLMAIDHEAIFQPERFEIDDVMGFLRNLSMYTLDKGPVIETGHTSDGPGGRWRAVVVEEALMPAPRAAIRWYADTGARPP